MLFSFPVCGFDQLAYHVCACSLSSGKKSILSALASLAAVRNEKLTSWRRTFEMYGRETCMRCASSDCDTPSSFIRRRIRRRNADPIWSTAFIIELERRVGVGERMSVSSSYELELESGMYFFIKEVNIRLISEANSSTSLIASMYPSDCAISSCVIVSYSEPRAIDRK